MKVRISASRGAALTRHTRFSAYCNCPNTVLAPSNVSSAPIASDHCAALLAAGVLDDGLRQLRALLADQPAHLLDELHVHLAVGEERAGDR